MKLFVRLTLILGLIVAIATPLSAQITSSQRGEIRKIQSTLGQVMGALRKKDRATAEEKLAEAEEQFEALKEATGLDESSPVFKTLVKLLNDRRGDLGQGTAAPAMKTTGRQPVNSGAVDPDAANNVSFVRDVVPIMTGKCLRCHTGGRARGGLDLSTFAGMKAGGSSGALLSVGRPDQSLLIERVVTDDFDLRMPQGGQLFDDEIAVLTKWIADGAKFDGNGETTPLRALGRRKEAPKEMVIAKPTGNETVSFKDDIGPMFNRICLDCHRGNNPSGGLSLETFNGLMLGGDSGPVIIPGDKENSRLFRLVGGLETPRMPADNQVRIRRSEYADLVKWFEEGNTFDGPDPATPILAYIDTPEKIAAREREARSEADWLSAREQSTKTLWKRGMPLLTPTFHSEGPVFAAGNVDNMSELTSVAEEQWNSLVSTFGKPNRVERGVSLLVVDSAYAHREMARALASTEIDAPSTTHAFSSPDSETRYAGVDATGASEDTLSLEDRVRVAIASAYFSARGETIPRWLYEGAGRALIVRADRSPAASTWRRTASRPMSGVNPAEWFEDSSFEPRDLPHVGYVLVDGLIDKGGQERLANLMRALGNGNDVNRAFMRTYGSGCATIGNTIRSSAF